MASYSSDQLVAHATADGQMVPTTQRARITGIQASASAASQSIAFHNGTANTAPLIAKFVFGTEGIDFYVPGSGILFEDGVFVDISANVTGVTITFT